MQLIISIINKNKSLASLIKAKFQKFDAKIDHGISFFFKHYGKTKFMIAMSKKAQYLGLENLFLKGPKAFFYFFMFYDA